MSIFEYFKGIFKIYTQYKVVGFGHEYFKSILKVFSIATFCTSLWAWGMSIFEYFKGIFNIYTQYKVVGIRCEYFKGTFQYPHTVQGCGREV